MDNEKTPWSVQREEFRVLVDDFLALVLEILHPVLSKMVDWMDKGVTWCRYQINKRALVSEAMKETIFALDEDDGEEWDNE